MTDELALCPFERRIGGLQGIAVTRHNREHEKRCAEAIRRRNHPAWSRMRCDYEVAA